MRSCSVGGGADDADVADDDDSIFEIPCGSDAPASEDVLVVEDGSWPVVRDEEVGEESAEVDDNDEDGECPSSSSADLMSAETTIRPTTVGDVEMRFFGCVTGGSEPAPTRATLS